MSWSLILIVIIMQIPLSCICLHICMMTMKLIRFSHPALMLDLTVIDEVLISLTTLRMLMSASLVIILSNIVTALASTLLSLLRLASQWCLSSVRQVRLGLVHSHRAQSLDPVRCVHFLGWSSNGSHNLWRQLCQVQSI